MKKQKSKIGIPRALLYHKYHILWESFFQEIGCEIMVSPETNQDILSRGLNLAIDESCLSVKIFLGHIDWLKDKADYIFIPHIVSIHQNEQMCVKLQALYDIARNTFDNIQIIDYTIDIENLQTQFWGFLKLGLKFNKNPLTVIKAYVNAQKKYKSHNKALISNQLETINDKKPSVLIVSHPYTTYDSLLGKPITSFLKSQDVNIIFSDIGDYQTSRRMSKNISSDISWSYNKELLGAIEMHKNHIDGIIFLMTFPCGPDSLVVNLCQNKLKIPMTVLILDELQGEAGLKTRLESFVDILKIRSKKYAI